MLLNIYIQEIHISAVPLLMEEKYLFISLNLIKDLKNFKNPIQTNPTKTTSLLLDSPAPGRAVDLLQQVAAFLLGAGGKKAVITGDDSCCPVESCMINSIIPIVLADFLPGICIFSAKNGFSIFFYFGDDVLPYVSVKVAEWHHHHRNLPLMEKKKKVEFH